MFFGKKKKEDKKEDIDLNVEDSQVDDIEVVLGDKSDLEISEVGDITNDLRPKDAETNRITNVIVPRELKSKETSEEDEDDEDDEDEKKEDTETNNE